MDAASVELSHKYLEACQKLFENGFLSHRRIFHVDSCVLKSIQDGYAFFTEWYKNLSEEGNKCFSVNLKSLIIFSRTVSVTLQDTRFLSWQSKVINNKTI